MGYDCKCGFTYCKTHRLPEDHNCPFDFAAREKERLAKNNPLVAANKLDKF
jgi:Predicted nucleic acid binding protein containing the AN1-type Zn-finger